MLIGPGGMAPPTEVDVALELYPRQHPAHPMARRTQMTTPSGELRQELSDMLRAAVTELFASLGVSLQYEGPFDPSRAVWPDPVALVGFAGEHMAGSLVLSAPWPMMAITNPVGDHGPEALADWSRELSNMTLGGVKLALLERGVHVSIGLPTSLVSTDLRIETTSRRALGHHFVHGPWPLLVALDGAVGPGLALQPPAGAGEPMSDGAVFF